MRLGPFAQRGAQADAADAQTGDEVDEGLEGSDLGVDPGVDAVGDAVEDENRKRLAVLRAPFVVESGDEESRAKTMPPQKRGDSVEVRAAGVVKGQDNLLKKSAY